MIVRQSGEFFVKPHVVGLKKKRLPILGNWVLTSRLSQSPHCSVFVAAPKEAPEEGSFVLKTTSLTTLNPSLAADTVRNEIETLTTWHLNHISCLIDASPSGPRPYFVMPRVEGWNLRHLLNGNAYFSISEKLWVCRQVSSTLSIFHAGGWLHGDISPGNLILSPNGHTTLVDFGNARAIQNLRSESIVHGTPEYMAPEAFVGQVDKNSDIYSLGVILYQWLTGHLPFQGNDAMQLSQAHLHGRVNDPRIFAPGLHPDLVSVVKQCLAKQPLRRPDAATLSQQLLRLEVELFGLNRSAA